MRSMTRTSISGLWLSVAATAAFALMVAACSSGEDKTGSSTDVGTAYPMLEPNHITEPQKFDGYNSNPPTSGTHWGRWAQCGEYPQGLDNEIIVHNLEHGNVVISYNLKDQPEIDRLTKSVRGLSEWGRWGVLRAYPGMGEGEVAIAGWGVMDAMKGVDEARLKKFWDTYAPNRRSGETQSGGPIPCNR